MEMKKTIWNFISVFLITVLIIAVLRGRAWLYIAAFIVWAAWVMTEFLIPCMRIKKIRKEKAHCNQNEDNAKQTEQMDPLISNNSDSLEELLLKHVNFRISSFFKSLYPDASWEWCDEHPEHIAAGSGTGRIRIYGIPDYNYAEVTCNQQAGIHCNLLKIVPLTEMCVQTESSTHAEQISAQNPVDPQIWYEHQGRKVLNSLITDLKSRGYDCLTIKENGDVVIYQEEREMKQAEFESIPERNCWQRLVKVFQREGIATKITENSMVLSW